MKGAKRGTVNFYIEHHVCATKFSGWHRYVDIVSWH
jgi:hypothetical protein